MTEITKKQFLAVKKAIRCATYNALQEQFSAEEWEEMLRAAKRTRGVVRYYQLADLPGHGTNVSVELFDYPTQINSNSLRERGFDPDFTDVRPLVTIDTVHREASIHGEWR